MTRWWHDDFDVHVELSVTTLKIFVWRIVRECALLNVGGGMGMKSIIRWSHGDHDEYGVDIVRRCQLTPTTVVTPYTIRANTVGM